MYHLRTPESTQQNPRAWCGAPVPMAPAGQAGSPLQPVLTQWEWVARCPAGVCQECVTAIERVEKSSKKVDATVDDDTCPF